MNDEIKQILTHLSIRNMNGHYVKNRHSVVEKALEMIKTNSSVGFGGSVTLEEIGILNRLREIDNIHLLDRTKIKKPEKIRELYLKMYSCDIFLSSTNAITLKGQLVNVDGRGNRTSMITFGPKKIIIIAGKNKITSDINSALERIKTIALPLNLKRIQNLSRNKSNHQNQEWTLESIWGQISIIERQPKDNNNRIHVILVNENLGF